MKEILVEDGLTQEQTENVISFISIEKNSFESTLNKLSEMFGQCDEIVRLSQILEMMKACGIQDDFILDTSITRGLDYYTGIVYETLLLDMPSIGSICSGGRYNNLAGLYTKENLPGVGSCIGLDRLIAALEELKSPIVTNASYADVMVIGKKEEPAWSESIAMKLRELGIRTDSYVGEKGTGQQFAYAEKNGIPYVIAAQNPEDPKLFSVKEIATRKMLENLTLEQIASLVRG